jgi:hypothetical protein
MYNAIRFVNMALEIGKERNLFILNIYEKMDMKYLGTGVKASKSVIVS